MTSKSSFFNLMKENFKRRTALPAIATLIFFFAMPIASLLVSDNYLRQLEIGASAADIANAKALIYRGFIDTHNAAGGLLILIILLAFISGISAFSYLHNGRKTDFYHSLPISRNRLYAVAVVNSILMIGIPYLIMAVASALIIGNRSGHTGCLSYALMNYLYGMCFFILFFATTVLAMMLTGTRLTGVMGTALLMSYGPAVLPELLSGQRESGRDKLAALSGDLGKYVGMFNARTCACIAYGGGNIDIGITYTLPSKKIGGSRKIYGIQENRGSDKAAYYRSRGTCGGDADGQHSG